VRASGEGGRQHHEICIVNAKGRIAKTLVEQVGCGNDRAGTPINEGQPGLSARPSGTDVNIFAARHHRPLRSQFSHATSHFFNGKTSDCLLHTGLRQGTEVAITINPLPFLEKVGQMPVIDVVVEGWLIKSGQGAFKGGDSVGSQGNEMLDKGRLKLLPGIEKKQAAANVVGYLTFKAVQLHIGVFEVIEQ